jgi:hypothetical protein
MSDQLTMSSGYLRCSKCERWCPVSNLTYDVYRNNKFFTFNCAVLLSRGCAQPSTPYFAVDEVYLQSQTNKTFAAAQCFSNLLDKVPRTGAYIGGVTKAELYGRVDEVVKNKLRKGGARELHDIVGMFKNSLLDEFKTPEFSRVASLDFSPSGVIDYVDRLDKAVDWAAVDLARARLYSGAASVVAAESTSASANPNPAATQGRRVKRKAYRLDVPASAGMAGSNSAAAGSNSAAAGMPGWRFRFHLE